MVAVMFAQPVGTLIVMSAKEWQPCFFGRESLRMLKMLLTMDSHRYRLMSSEVSAEHALVSIWTSSVWVPCMHYFHQFS